MNGSSSPQTPEVARLVEEARQLRPWTAQQRARAWQELSERASRRSALRAWPLVAGGLSAVAAAALAFVMLGDVPTRDLGAATSTPAVATESLRAVEGAQFTSVEEPGGRRVALTSGVLELQGGSPDARRWKVQTPHLFVSAPFGSGVRVSAGASFTEVQVTAGAARVELAEGRFAVLFAGESLRSDQLDSATVDAPQRTRAATPVVTSSPVAALAPKVKASDAMSRTRCGRAGSARGAQRDCLATEARGGDLAAENALFALALLTREEQGASQALPHFEAYARRFEHGVFAPEAQLAIAEAQLALGNTLAAEAALTKFLASFPDDPRRAQVRAALRDEAFSRGEP